MLPIVPRAPSRIQSPTRARGQVRVGDQNVDAPGWIKDYIAKELAPQLQPIKRAFVDQQAPGGQTQVMQGQYGTCVDNDGNTYTVLIGYDTSAMRDEYNLTIPGGPATDDDTQTMNTGGSGLILGRTSLDLRPLPYMSGAEFGAGTYTVDYGNYDVPGGVTPYTTSAIVTRPFVAVKTGTGTFVDASGFVTVRKALYDAINNIVLTDQAPSVPPAIALSAGDGLQPNKLYQYGLALHYVDGWSMAGPSAQGITKKANGTNQCQFSVAWDVGSLPAGVDEVGIVRTKHDDGTWYLLATSASASGSLTDSTADSGLSAFTEGGSKIATADWLIQSADPPASPNTPAGQYTFGHGGQRTDLAGFTYDGNSGTGAYFLGIINEDHPFDVEAVYGQRSDKSFYGFGSIYNRFVDPVNHPIGETEGPSISTFTSGVSHAWGGLVTAVVAGHDPTDADVSKDPYIVDGGGNPVYADGTLAIRQDAGNETLAYRANGLWWPIRRGGFGWDSSFIQSGTFLGRLGATAPNIKVITAYDDPENGRTAFGFGIMDAATDEWFNGDLSGPEMDLGDGYNPLFGVIPIQPAYGGTGEDNGTFGTYAGTIADLRLDGHIHMSGSILTGVYAQGTFGPNRGQSHTNYNPTYMFGGSVILGVGAAGSPPTGYVSSHSVYGDIEFFDGVTLTGGLGATTMTDGANLALGTTAGTKIGTSTTQKLGFFNADPVVQPGVSGDISAIVDTNVKAVLTSLCIALGGGFLGLIQNDTT